jgi:hypothetical protein
MGRQGLVWGQTPAMASPVGRTGCGTMSAVAERCPSWPKERDWKSRTRRKLGRGFESRPLRLFASFVRPGRDPRLRVDHAALHAARDDDDLAGDVARDLVGREGDDLTGDVLGLGDLPKRHRP